MLFTLKIVWKLVKLSVRAVRKLVGLALLPVTLLLGQLGGDDDDATARTDATDRPVADDRPAADAPDRRGEAAAGAEPPEPSDPADAYDTTASSAAGTAPDDAGDPAGRPTGEGVPTAAADATGGAATAAALGVDGEADEAYRTFRQALFLYAGWVVADLVLWFTVISGRFGVQLGDLQAGTLLLSVGLGAAVPAGLGALARRRTKAVWGVAFGLAAFTLATSALGALGVHLFGPFGSNVELMTDLSETPLLGISRLVGIGILGRVTYYGWRGRAAVGVGVEQDTSAAARTGTPGAASAAAGGAQSMSGATASGASDAAAAAPTDEAGAGADGTGGATQSTADDGVAEGTPTASATEPSEDAPAAPADASAEAPAEAATASQSTAGAQSGDASGTPSRGTPADAPSAVDDVQSPGDDAVAASSGGASDDAAAASGDGEATGEPADPVAAALADVDHADPDPDAVRALGDAVATAGLTDEAAAALSSLTEADDEAVRLAVCAVCRQLSDDRADDVLRRLRIDTSDEVSSAAIAALRGR